MDDEQKIAEAVREALKGDRREQEMTPMQRISAGYAAEDAKRKREENK